MRRSKYRNVPTVVNGFRFDSKAESKRYLELCLLLSAKQIEDLVIHPRFPLDVNGQKICTYEADFRYYDVKRGTYRIEDVKGARTALFILKKKLMKACHGLEVEELSANRRVTPETSEVA